MGGVIFFDDFGLVGILRKLCRVILEIRLVLFLVG